MFYRNSRTQWHAFNCSCNEGCRCKGVGSYEARFSATAKLFDYGFTQFSTQEIVPANYVFKENKTVKVIKGKEGKVGIAVKEPISFMVKSSEKDLYVPKLSLKKEQLEAEVKKGTTVGKVTVERSEGKDYGFIDGSSISVDVVTTDKVERASWLSLMFQGISNFFGNVWGGISDFVGSLF